MRKRACYILLASWSLIGCDEAAPTSSTLTLTNISPPSGSTVRASRGTPPGVFIDRGSGALSMDITILPAREASWAGLYVYLLTADGNYCGQNLPDAPTWGPLRAFGSERVTVSGFQVFRVPCDVLGLRAMVHTRNTGLLTPPVASETVAEATVPVSLRIVGP
jgi:hypothetical protein